MKKSIAAILLLTCVSMACNFGDVKNAESNNNVVKKDVAFAVNEKESNRNETLSTVSKEVSADQNKTATPKKDETEKRCGWYVNPTPANHYLLDKDGTWVIGEQGGYQVEDKDYDNIPDFGDEWVKRNVGSYGYGCACFNVTVNKKEMKILSINSGAKLPLSKCQNDKTLPKP